MRRAIVDFKKLPPEVFNLLAAKYPDGYGDRDIIKFENHHNEIIEAVEVRTEDTIYLVKVNSKLHYTLVNFDNDAPIQEIDDLSIYEEETEGETNIDYLRSANTAPSVSFDDDFDAQRV